MENKIISIAPLLERAEDYGKTSLELMKLKALNITSEAVSTFISRSIAALVLFVSVMFSSIGAALWLGELLGRIYYGFFCVAGFYALTGGVLYFIMHKWMKKRVSASIIKQVLK
ncbi:MAG: hypothetical protein NT150_07150 [Bacteroidetes bacterium]|nr:hypothetical protein [Bacteroidota bacterium]